MDLLHYSLSSFHYLDSLCCLGLSYLCYYIVIFVPFVEGTVTLFVEFVPLFGLVILDMGFVVLLGVVVLVPFVILVPFADGTVAFPVEFVTLPIAVLLSLFVELLVELVELEPPLGAVELLVLFVELSSVLLGS